MADNLKRYSQLQDELNKLQQELEALQDSPEIKRDLEFKGHVENLLDQYGYAISDVFRVLSPGDESFPGRKTKTRAQRPMQVYKNPHTDEVVKTRGGNQKTLKQWREEYGRDTVQSWRIE